VKTTGDGFLTVFDSPTRAVQCAAAMTRATRAIEIEIRVGVHTGEVELVGDDVRGIAVHIAARVLALAGPGEVLVPSTTSELLEGSGMVLEDAGTHKLEGLAGTRQVFPPRRAANAMAAGHARRRSRHGCGRWGATSLATQRA
jgi:class 3 adenylate cyclase